MTAKEIREHRQRVAEAQHIYSRIERGKVKCQCGGKCRAQIMPNGGCGSMRQQIRFYCSNKKCCVSSEWHDDHDTVDAWREWKERQHQRKRKRRSHVPRRNRGGQKGV